MRMEGKLSFNDELFFKRVIVALTGLRLSQIVLLSLG